LIKDEKLGGSREKGRFPPKKSRKTEGEGTRGVLETKGPKKPHGNWDRGRPGGCEIEQNNP